MQVDSQKTSDYLGVSYSFRQIYSKICLQKVFYYNPPDFHCLLNTNITVYIYCIVKKNISMRHALHNNNIF